MSQPLTITATASVTATASATAPAQATEQAHQLYAVDTPVPVAVEQFLESLTRCVLEVLAGVRDLDQLARWVSDDVYQNLTRRVVLSSRARQVKGQRLIRPTFSIGRTVVSEPSPGIIEGVVIVHGKARTRAVALRLERLGARWRASAVTVL
ncbi:Rv3235 family protein [Subtercola vilae]|uniref:3-hydroxyacyl-CoA dehydrogenase n=1 Tax=Subtercola vilae TaxID=2056433 RepID=A0A4T2C2F7_9MICO|nr:Rv3235 family protein [Subtercola vilae]TIH37839.1 3-hydroxyacyl-CoA dehydrogenase [Subtercola vilae]